MLISGGVGGGGGLTSDHIQLGTRQHITETKQNFLNI